MCLSKQARSTEIIPSRCHCPACRTTLIATRFWVVMICPIIKCLIVLEFSFILFDLCLFITIINFILNYVPIVTFFRFQGLSYSHVPECIEFSFICLFIIIFIFILNYVLIVTFWIFIYHEIWILLNIYLYGTTELFILWHVWRYSGVLWVNSCPPLSRTHQAVMHEWAGIVTPLVV